MTCSLVGAFCAGRAPLQVHVRCLALLALHPGFYEYVYYCFFFTVYAVKAFLDVFGFFTVRPFGLGSVLSFSLHVQALLSRRCLRRARGAVIVVLDLRFTLVLEGSRCNENAAALCHRRGGGNFSGLLRRVCFRDSAVLRLPRSPRPSTVVLLCLAGAMAMVGRPSHTTCTSSVPSSSRPVWAGGTEYSMCVSHGGLPSCAASSH